jgi:hypothetical protein
MPISLFIAESRMDMEQNFALIALAYHAARAYQLYGAVQNYGRSIAKPNFSSDLSSGLQKTAFAKLPMPPKSIPLFKPFSRQTSVKLDRTPYLAQIS